MSRPLPPSKLIRDLFEDLLGRTVNVAPTEPLRSTEMHQSVVAVYVDDQLHLAAAAGLSLPLAIYAASALGLIPPGGAREFVKDREVTPLLAENAKEICNILGTVLNKEGLPPIRHYNTYFPDGPAPPNDVGSHLLALGRRVDLLVEVSGYGGGKFSLSLVD